ncbi:MAG TPA: septal ring lytic transglycosylase RlpA family protein [Thermomicrobiales bacterium]|nr:septal ring lytic transglycosylase RlpA family protein [Thermomicrobiales bacterium]
MGLGAIDGSSWVRVALGACLIALAACSSSPPPPGPTGIYKLGEPYQIQGRWYYPEFDPSYDRVGVASWYGEPFHGRRTANGEIFDRDLVTAAHPTLPLPSLVRVVNLQNGRELMVRVNDRGPFVGDRIIDLSQEAARQLGFEGQGLAPVRVQFVGLADARGEPPRPTVRHARAPTPEPPAEAAPAVVTTAAAQCEGSFIQVGAFAEPARAQRIAAELNALQPLPVSLATHPADQLARVRLGPMPDRSTAHAALDRLRRSGFSGAFIVVPEPTSSC